MHVEIQQIYNVWHGQTDRAILFLDNKEERVQDGHHAIASLLAYLSGRLNGEAFTFNLRETVFVDENGTVVGTA